MLHDGRIQEYVSDAVSRFSFETVADLSKEEFVAILSQSLAAVLNSHEFTQLVSQELAMEIRRRR